MRRQHVVVAREREEADLRIVEDGMLVAEPAIDGIRVRLQLVRERIVVHSRPLAQPNCQSIRTPYVGVDESLPVTPKSCTNFVR